MLLLNRKINRDTIYLATIVTVTLALYWNSLSGDFVWDDRGLILDKATYLNNWANLYEGFYRPFFGEISYYRPILIGSFIIDYQLWGDNPFGYHFTNLVLHIANALLVYILIVLLFNKKNTAFLTSLLFTSHPVQSEAVAWISGRNDLLLTFFALLGIMAHLLCMRHQGWRKQFMYACCLLAYGGALLTKESAVIMPLLFLLIDYFYIDGKQYRFRYYAGITLVAVAYYFAKTAIVGDMGIDLRGRVLDVFSGMIVTYAYYFRMLIFPLFQSAVPAISASGFDRTFVLISSYSLVLCLLLIAIVCMNRFKDISFAILWVVTSIIPVCGIIPLTLPALEHRLYLATVCFSMMLPLIAERLSRLPTQSKKMNRAKMTALVIVPIVMIFYSSKTVARNTVWQNELTLWSKTVTDSHGSSLALSNLGLVYARAGAHEIAISQFKKALEMADQGSASVPGNGNVHKGKLFNNLGQSYYQLLRKHVQNDADVKPAVAAEATYSESAKNDVHRLYELSRASYQQALRINPASADVHNNLGDLFYIMKNYPDAEKEYIEALKRSPNHAQYYNNLGLVYYGMKNNDEAEEKFSRAISLRHDFWEARNNLALVYLRRGMYQKALEQLEMVRSYGPDDNAGVCFNLALVYLRGFQDRQRAAYYLREATRKNRWGSTNPMIRDSSRVRIDNAAIDS